MNSSLNTCPLWVGFTLSRFGSRGNARLAGLPSNRPRCLQPVRSSVFATWCIVGSVGTSELSRCEPHSKLIVKEGDVIGRLVNPDRQGAADAVTRLAVDGKVDRPVRSR